MDSRHYIDDVLARLKKYKELAERAFAQISEDDFIRSPDPHSNSIAIIVKHMAGNMRSRWTDFLTTDGEKPDRYRDQEFTIEKQDDFKQLWTRWEEGWRICLDAIGSLEPEDLNGTVVIRGESQSVITAIHRQLTHYAYHVGQIVYLARHFAGENWRSLSIPKGKSEEYNAALRR